MKLLMELLENVKSGRHNEYTGGIHSHDEYVRSEILFKYTMLRNIYKKREIFLKIIFFLFFQFI